MKKILALASLIVGLFVLWQVLSTKDLDTATDFVKPNATPVSDDNQAEDISGTKQTDDQSGTKAADDQSGTKATDDLSGTKEAVSADSASRALSGMRYALEQALKRQRSFEAQESILPRPVFTADKEGIQAAMNAAKPHLKECYEPWLEINPELGGKLTTSFTIPAEGGTTPSAAVKEGGLGEELLDNCILAVLQTELEFEAPSSGEAISVSYPLIFSQ